MFSDYFLDYSQEPQTLLNDKINHTALIGKTKIFKVNSGDIVAFVFWKNSIIYRFEGICIAIKRTSFNHLDTSICIRNIIFGIGIEMMASYFMNRVYSLVILDYKRKQFLYRKSKLYYLRGKFNRSSRVK